MSERVRPSIAFKFAEDTEYYRNQCRDCEVTFTKNQLQFRFDRYGSTSTVCMANEDFDAFLTWYSIAKRFNDEVAPVLDTSE